MPGYNMYGTPQFNMPMQMGLKGRPVSSLDEAKAAQIDFDGSLFIFPDVVNKKIYTKQIGMDGIVTVNQYTLSELPKEESYITRKEFEDVINQFKEALSNKDNKKDTTNNTVPNIF